MLFTNSLKDYQLNFMHHEIKLDTFLEIHVKRRWDAWSIGDLKILNKGTEN